MHALFEAPDREKLAAERSWDPETAGYLRLVEQLDTNVGDHPEIYREPTGIMNDTYNPLADFPLSETEQRVFVIRTWGDIDRE